MMIDKSLLRGRAVVASISGGKDSAAMSLWLMENDIPHERIFSDTGWEHRLTYEHLRGPLTEKLGPIRELVPPLSMVELIKKKGMFPSRTVRFCSEELKFKVIQRYLLGRDDDPINAIGIRRAESQNRQDALEWEWNDDLDCEIWRPLVTWTREEVIAIHKRHGLPLNPLYLMGANRVGCWPCVFASKAEIALVADTDPARIDQIRAMEADAQASQRARHPEGIVGGTMASMFTLRPDNKTHIAAHVDDVVAWARTPTRGRPPEQPTLFDSACMRWGVCETPEPEP
jgi:3'-phosphoadenosine 5'-phosphosulfate sulfotransferase (PAPS reductase)/FAD synthetase